MLPRWSANHPKPREAIQAGKAKFDIPLRPIKPDGKQLQVFAAVLMRHVYEWVLGEPAVEIDSKLFCNCVAAIRGLLSISGSTKQ